MLLIPSARVLVNRALTLHAGHDIPGRMMILFLLKRSSDVTNVMFLPELIAGIVLVLTVCKLIPWVVVNYLRTVLCKLVALVAMGQLHVPGLPDETVSVPCIELGMGLMGDLMDRLTTLLNVVPVACPQDVTCD